MKNEPFKYCDALIRIMCGLQQVESEAQHARGCAADGACSGYRMASLRECQNGVREICALLGFIFFG